MKSPAVSRPSVPLPLFRVAGIALLTVGTQFGCGREFFREWADQDVSEAVFEKSRDPRYRLDLFSVTPPAMARFADPYDQERPPAPPDDYATQALSPVPQWPDHRLMMPVEGTGYLALLEKDAKRYQPPPPAPPRAATTPPPGTTPPPSGSPSPFAPTGTGLGTIPVPGPAVPVPGMNPVVPVPGTSPIVPVPGIDQPVTEPGAPPPLPGSGASRSNSGTRSPGMSPISVTATPPAPQAKSAEPRITKQDDGLRRVAAQSPTQPMPIQTPLSTPDTTPTAPGDPLRTPRTPNDPNPTDDRLDLPVNPRPDLAPGDFRASEEATANLSGLFVPEDVTFDEAVAVGLRSNSRPPILTMEKAFEVALVNSRTYQTQLENLYGSALPVTLQRFAFQPQAFVGLSPPVSLVGPATALSGIAPAVNPANSFLYSTRETGAQQSTLNLGTVAGVGKTFDAGTRVLASFASSIVFNFVGKNPTQPTVRSFLPLTIVQPFLRGGGRAVVLEALTQAERNLVYAVRSFARFRQEFVVATLVGGQGAVQNFGTSVTTGGFTGGGNIDPTIGFLNLVEDAQLVENQQKNVAVFERIRGVYEELVRGESSGLTQLQVDQINQNLQDSRNQLLQVQNTFRNDIDQFKIQLGMPPDVPMVIDRSRTQRFRQIFKEIEDWSLSPRRELDQLDGIIARLPDLEDVKFDGRSCVQVFRTDEDQNLEDLLLTGERLALENRLDLMNARAQLYDVWRQIRVSANALKGVFNVAVTNQFVTPPTTNNPFAFIDQAKNFSLVLNAELPLVRLSERNAFRTALINYQRQRRALQNAEDQLKYNIRLEIRQLEVTYRQFGIAKRNLALAVRVKDQAFEQLIAPPAGTSANSQAAVQTNNLTQAQSRVVSTENQLIQFWYNYQTQRLILYRDLGILPYDEWEAFDELFPPDRVDGAYTAPADSRPAAVQPAEAGATPVGRP